MFVYLITESQAPELAVESKCAGKILMLHALLYSVRRHLMITMVTMSELDLLMDSPLDHSAPVKTSPRLLVSDQETDQWEASVGQSQPMADQTRQTTQSVNITMMIKVHNR